MEWAKNNCKEHDIEFAMDSCAEWLYLRSLSNPHYSEEQRERIAKKWLKEYPEFELLSTDPQEIEFAQIISKFPQQFHYYAE